jgi:REP element-mobilizing transposase RayT
MVRGIERKAIFSDDCDRSAFVARLSHLLVKTGTDCLAWSLMSNHAHLLLRPNKGKLSEMMRRLLSGYAIAIRRFGYTAVQVSKSLALSPSGVLLAAKRGEVLYEKYEELRNLFPHRCASSATSE